MRESRFKRVYVGDSWNQHNRNQCMTSQVCGSEGVSFDGPWTLSPTPQCGGVGPPPKHVSDFSFFLGCCVHSLALSQRREREVIPLLVLVFLRILLA